MTKPAKKMDVIQGGRMANFQQKIVNQKPPVQRTFDFMMRKNVKDIVDKTLELHDSVQAVKVMNDNDFEACILVAATIKDDIKRTGMSREQVVDKINTYFGRTLEGAKAKDPTCFNLLTIAQFNNYLSKPTVHRIPAFLLFAIQRVCNSMAVAKMYAEHEGGKVLAGEEVKRFYLMKVNESIDTLKKAQKDLQKSL